MKNYVLILVAFLFSFGIMAQDRGSVILNAYASYTFSNNVNFDYGHLKIGDGITYGGGFEFFPQKSSSVELKYLRLDTSMDIDVPNGVIGYEDKNGDGAFNYILIGGNHYFDTGGNAVPYLGGGIGMAITEGPYGGSDTNFAWEIKGGVKIKTNSSVSVSLQANLISTIAAAGTDTYWGYWGPIAVQDYAYSYQFGLGAVIGFNLK
ncbi:outer membrane beta-barrel protein [Flavobacterium sp.]|uniref:outer membrane beta-barrel protein n=1 Tax=Flavobacterium sp. TaxID=239 RepID=UPI002C364DCE|nr:outer membrane beta-barrel protein [Flavobacterium sp.]HSD06725.1 outer membrane beta-barrel protein [Flavobacterium sp.]